MEKACPKLRTLGFAICGAVDCTSSKQWVQDLPECASSKGFSVTVYPRTFKLADESGVDDDDDYDDEEDEYDDMVPIAMDEVDAKKLWKIVTRPIPDKIFLMGAPLKDQFIANALKHKQIPVIMIGTADEPPMALKAYSADIVSEFFSVAYTPENTPEMLASFGLPDSYLGKTTLIMLWPKPDEDDSKGGGGVGVSIIVYDRRQLGKMQYSSMLSWTISALQQLDNERFVEWAALYGSRFGIEMKHGSGATSSKPRFKPADDLSVPMKELTHENFDDVCDKSVCAIGIFDGSRQAREDGTLDASLETLRAARKRSVSRNDPFKFMWIDGRCRQKFASSFGVDQTSLPTVVAYSPSKGMHAQLVGVYRETSVLTFLAKVKKGHVKKMAQKPAVDAVEDCLKATEIIVDEDDDDDDMEDMMAEIRAEEEREERERSAALEADKEEERLLQRKSASRS